MDKQCTWIKLADAVETIPFNAEGLASVAVNGKPVCLILHKDKLSACAAQCPHAGGTMAGGYVDGKGNIVCPLHGYRFSVANGRSSEGYFLKIYKVEERADGVYVLTP